MTSEDIAQYYDATRDSEPREDLRYAVSLVKATRLAIDCGCGAGSDIAHLRSEGFVVHAFDIEPEAIDRCSKRFRGDKDVFLDCESFTSFSYPTVSLVSADAALFFCPSDDFEEVWQRICDCLPVGGVFCGSFLGPEDSMAEPGYDRGAFWGEALVFTEASLRPKFEHFSIRRWTEHRLSEVTDKGLPHEWHIYSVVAIKL